MVHFTEMISSLMTSLKNVSYPVYVVPLALPDPPEEPEIVSKTSQSVTLSWFTPLSDGGAPIFGYNVEMKSPGGDWQQCNPQIIQSMEYVVQNLKPGEPYRFRISSINKLGVGEPVHLPQTVQLGENLWPRTVSFRKLCRYSLAWLLFDSLTPWAGKKKRAENAL